MQQALPRAFLEASAPGYLTGTEWDTLPEAAARSDEALTYTGKPCKGVRGPLSRLKVPPPGGEQAEAAYQLADYLDQHGRHQRHALVPPPSFWVAARCAQPADLIAFAAAARARGLYRFGAQLLKSAASRGDPSAGADLIAILHDLHPGDHRPAQWVIGDITVDLDDPHGVTMMLERLLKVDAQDLIAALLARNPATHVALHDVLGATVLLAGCRRWARRSRPPRCQSRRQARSLDDLVDVALLLGRLLEAGAREQATTLADRAAKHAPLDDPNGVALLLDQLLEAGARDPVTALLARNPAGHFSLDHPGGIESLLHTLRRMGAQEQLAMLADRAADVLLDDPGRVASLLGSLQEVGAREQATTLANRAAAQVSLNDPHGVAVLLYRLRTMGAQEQVTTLADRAADVSLDDPFGVAWLLDGLRWADAHDQATALTHRVSHVSLDDRGVLPSCSASCRKRALRI